MTRLLTSSGAALPALAGPLIGTAGAQVAPVPETVPYVGTLYRSDGVTPEDGPVTLVVRIYENKGDAEPVWSEVYADVELLEGAFAVELGEGEAVPGEPRGPLRAVFGETAPWLGVSVGGEPERGARRQLVSAPYALTADTAVFAKHGVPPGTMAAWTGDEAPEGWLFCDGAVYEQASYSALFATIGTVWGGSGTTFRVPNLGGRILTGAVEAGEGQDENSPNQVPASSGLTDHALGDLLGSSVHVLTVDELAAHTHSYVDVFWSGRDGRDTWAAHAMYPEYIEEDRVTASAGGIDTDNDGVPDAAASRTAMCSPLR